MTKNKTSFNFKPLWK